MVSVYGCGDDCGGDHAHGNGHGYDMRMI